MQRKKSLSVLIDYLILFIIASLTFLVIPAWIPILRKGWQLLIVATLVIIVYRHKTIDTKSMIPLALYSIVLYLNAMSGDFLIGSTTNAINEVMVLFVPAALALYCTKGASGMFVKWLLTIALVFLLIELVASVIILESQPGIIRSMHAMVMEEADISYMFEFYRFGLLDYSMAHAIPILIPPIVCYFKDGKTKIKIFCTLMILACVFLTWLSESTTALMLVVLMIILGFWVNTRLSYRRNIIVIAFMVGLSVLLMSSDQLMMGILDVSGNLVGEESTQYAKIEEMRMSLIEDQATGDLLGRMNRYQISISQFFENPILGTNMKPGRHSSLLDKLATLGLVGFVPLMLFFWHYLKTIWNTLIPNRRIYYLECIIAAFLMVLFKGMWVWPIFFFLFMVSPSMLVTSQSIKTSHRHSLCINENSNTI